jgi:hypothetical protein
MLGLGTKRRCWELGDVAIMLIFCGDKKVRLKDMIVTKPGKEADRLSIGEVDKLPCPDSASQRAVTELTEME